MGDIELEIFAQRLRELRISLGMTQKEFASELNITASALSSYEKNNINPSISIAKRIAEKYHVSIDWLCGLTDKQNYDSKIKTYNDLFRILFEIEDSCKDTLFLSHAIECAPISSPTIYELNGISFSEDDVQKFITEWAKMKKLHEDNIIDDEVYNLWKEKILNRDYYFLPDGGFSDLMMNSKPTDNKSN